ncbi:MAG: UDP-2,3-diacylglucosamine hydrolase [Fervidobacterium sp.]|uniref:metallophosphoesterase n=1 Tax=Fervidobacterium sp. TaxID=1871331 RepID=UPI0025BC3F81|nr:metallophosphoesterase [Fervidobacterium sp.]NPU88706.1 UDP-2,3-diacylglucosamine hydrolase [Fervidobacterium sp.]
MRNIIFISDLHIGDGNSKDDFSQDELFNNFINEWNDLENPELVIVGDGFEILESEIVRHAGLKPFWEIVHSLDGKLITLIEHAHPKVFEALSKFKGKIKYIIGNHDYYILKNQKLQENLKERIKNLEIVPYYYDEQTHILAVHGNQFDAINRFLEVNGEIIPPLGDFISRYMMVNFDDVLKEYLPDDVVSDYDNVRPTLDVFEWLEQISKVYETSVDLLKLWIDNFITMMREEEAKYWMKKNYPFLSKLSILFLNKIGGIKLGELLVRAVMKTRNLKKTDYLKKAAVKIFEEPGWLFRNMDGYLDKGNAIGTQYLKDIQGIVMGHNHKPGFELIKIKNDVKFYVNCGSWKPVVERKSRNIFQRYFEIFYAIARVENSGEIEIITGSVNKLRKKEVIS